jgi:hypothetical protein
MHTRFHVCISLLPPPHVWSLSEDWRDWRRKQTPLCSFTSYISSGLMNISYELKLASAICTNNSLFFTQEMQVPCFCFLSKGWMKHSQSVLVLASLWKFPMNCSPIKKQLTQIGHACYWLFGELQATRSWLPHVLAKLHSLVCYFAMQGRPACIQFFGVGNMLGYFAMQCKPTVRKGKKASNRKAVLPFKRREAHHPCSSVLC